MVSSKPFISCLIFFYMLTVTALSAEVEINTTDLESSSPIYISEGGIIDQIPDSGIIKINPDYLPTLVELNTKNGSKLKTHASIWLTGNTLTLEGSVDDDTIQLSAGSHGKIIERDLKKEWKRLKKNKDQELHPWKPLLVYVANHIKFQKPEELKQLMEQLSDEEREFWAGRDILTFLDELEQIGYDASNERFEHLAALNKKGEKEKYERPDGKYLLIDFAASWCKPCLDELDDLAELNEEYRDNVELLSIWRDEDHNTWLNSAKKPKENITWTSLRDDTGAIMEAFGVNIYPTYLLIDPDGYAVKRVESARLKKIERYLKRL